MRLALLLALLLAGCTDKLDGKTAEEWNRELSADETGASALDRLERHGTEATGILTAIVTNGTPKAQAVAIELLMRLGPDALPAAPALVGALGAKDPIVRGRAAIALGRIGPGAHDAVVPLDRALRDRDIRVRVAASLAIYGITGDSSAATRILFAAFGSKDPDVRAMVAQAFSEIGTPVTPFLVRSLKNPDESTRVTAARTLAAMGSAALDAKEALHLALEDPSEDVRAAAADALTKIEPQ